MCPKVQFSQNTSWKSATQGTLAEGRCRSYGEGFCRKTRLKAAEILCVFQGFYNAALRQKDRRRGANFFKSVPKNKKGRGETSPRTQTPFAAAEMAAQRLGGQNLAALCTAAGENLTAVGSSHSLAETVNLGTVTAAGLVGTLHSVHLLRFLSSMLDSLQTGCSNP